MNETAPKGQVWICTACKKRAHDKYGFDAIDYGYDESCMMHSVLVDETEAKEARRAWQARQEKEYKESILDAGDLL